MSRNVVRVIKKGKGVKFKIQLAAPIGEPDPIVERDFTYNQLKHLPAAPKKMESSLGWYINRDKKIEMPSGRFIVVRVVIEGWRETSVYNDHSLQGIYLLKELPSKEIKNSP